MVRRFLIGLLALALVSCTRGDEGAQDYTKEVRFPDDQGLITSVDVKRLELDGARSFQINPEVQSFSTYTGKTAALLSWKNKYVHLGLNKKKEVVWVTGIGVLDRTQEPPLVYYTNGKFRRLEKGRQAVFADGTVLKLGSGVAPPPANARVTARIDSVKHVVVGFSIVNG